VAQLLATQPAVMRDELWFPLCLAALNTAPSRASAQIFLNILRETFGAGASAVTLVRPRTGLGDAIPHACARWLEAHGHAVRVKSRGRIASVDDTGVLIECAGESVRAPAVVVAVGPHQLAGAFTPDFVDRHANVQQALASVAAFEYEAITTLYLGYDAPIALPAGLLRLERGPGQWIFDRSDILRRAAPDAARPPMQSLVSVVISASAEHASLDHAALAAKVDAQLRTLARALPPLTYSRVIDEKRATYAAVPRLVRPAAGRLTDRVYLAGDYSYDEFPATLEGAVRSGRIAAARLTRDFATAAAARDSIRVP
jgi:predicted NAD/FAD-dependent oxidoreductase